MIIYGLLDLVVGKIVPETLVAAPNHEAMRRMLRDTVSGSHPVARHPEDYQLVALGTWDILDSGQVLGFEAPQMVDNMRVVLNGRNTPLAQEV